MKTRIYKSILALAIMFTTLPMTGQDFMNIYFKNGDFRKFYMKNITEIATSKTDADGVLHDDYDYQYITTIYDRYVYNLADVDSITFTDIDEQKAEENFVSAMPVVFDAISDCETIDDVEGKIDQIKNAEGVADAWSDGHQLYVAIGEDEVYSFHFNHDVISNEEATEKFAAQIKALKSALKPRLANITKPDGSPLKAVIANQTDKDEDEAFVGVKEKFLLPLKDFLNNCDIDARYEPNPNIDFFYNKSDNPQKHLNFYDYDIIILSTHGSYGPISYRASSDFLGINIGVRADGIMGHSFITSEDIMEQKYELLANWNIKYGTFKEWRDKTPYHDLTDVHINYTFHKEIRGGEKVWIAHPELTEYFFRDIAKGKFENSNSFFFNFACKSLKGDNIQRSNSFAKILFEKRNLGVYAGYTESDFSAAVAARDLFHSMLSGYSLEKSLEDLTPWCKRETIENIEKDADYYVQCFDQESLEEVLRTGDIHGAELKIFDKTGSVPHNFFLLPPHTEEINEDDVDHEYYESSTVTLNGDATLLNFDVDAVDGIQVGFVLTYQDPVAHTQYINTKNVHVSENNKVEFFAKLENLERGKTYQYRAYTYDGLNYNYGNICSFTIPEEGLMLSCVVNDVKYSLYEKQNKEEVQLNADNSPYYMSELWLEITKGGITSTFFIDENFFAGDETNPHKCMAIDLSSRMIYLFANAKTRSQNYRMDGFFYYSSLDDINFQKETVFSDANWGWFPYFTYDNETLSIQHFNFAGYYAMASTRDGGGNWSTSNMGGISPDEFAAQSKQAGIVLIFNSTGGGGNTAYTSCPDDHHPHMIDLGLPLGTKWACCNVGATTPEGYGDYFAWGEKKPNDVYNWDTYFDSSYEKYNGNGGLTELLPEDDAATVNMGAPWRMPTISQLQELIDNCSRQWTTQNGVNGTLVTGPNGGQVFLPAAGYRWDDEVNHAGSYGIYWSSSLGPDGDYGAYYLYFDSGYWGWYSYGSRSDGQSVRAVRKQ